MPDLGDNTTEWFSLADAEAFTKRVFNGAYKDGSFDKKRVSQYARAFSTAVIEGYGKGKPGLSDIDYDTPDGKMLAALRDNVFHFSAAKNRSEIVAMSNALRDTDGRLRSFSEFKVEAAKIAEEFQGRYLQVEYDLAVNSATLAARWAEYDDDDILVYRTAHDERVRESHRELEGIAKPKGDPFWSTYYPPNGWNCRCTVEVTHSGRITPAADTPNPVDNIPAMFRTNFAQHGWAFPPNHPYFKNLPAGPVEIKSLSKEVLKASRDEVRSLWFDNISPGEILRIPTTAKHIDELSITRATIKTLTAKPHNDYLERNEAVKDLKALFDSSKYVGWAQDEIIDGVQKHRDVRHWLYYEVEIGGKKSYICVKSTIDGLFKPYSIEDAYEFKKIKGVKRAKPPK